MRQNGEFIPQQGRTPYAEAEERVPAKTQFSVRPEMDASHVLDITIAVTIHIKRIILEASPTSLAWTLPRATYPAPTPVLA